jgi:hypothetical protein
VEQDLPITAKSLPELENKCLGYLFMKLEGVPVEPENPGSSKREQTSAVTEQIDLYLNLQFDEQQERLPKGRIKFGLKGGAISIKLRNGRIPLETSQLGSSFKLAVRKDKQQQENNETQSARNLPIAESTTEVQSNLESQETAGRTDKFQYMVCQVTTNGSEENPTWILEVERGEPFLKGLLKNGLLGTMNVMKKPCYLEATFNVSARDVCITDVEGVWPSNISKKRSAVIERAIVRCFLKRKFKPYLSRVELRYD